MKNEARPAFRILPKDNAMFDIAPPKQRSFMIPEELGGSKPQRELPQPKVEPLPMDKFVPA